MGKLSAAEMVHAARDLEPVVRDIAVTIERDGQLPQRLVDAMTAAGVFCMYQPENGGGPELDPVSSLLVTEHLARADGSVAWCASVSTALSNALGWLSEEGLAEVTGGSLTRLAGSARPLGMATKTEGGYVVRGHWDFASNVLQADWYVGACVVDEGTVGAVAKVRAMFIPIAEGRVERTWSVLGLRGTGSHDFVVDETFVPARRVASLRYALARKSRVYDPRLDRVMMWSPTAGVALGLARGALDDFAVLSRAKTTMSTVPLRERPDVHTAVGRAEAIVAACRAYCLDAIAAAWEAVGADVAPNDLDRAIAHAQLAITFAMNQCVDAVDRLLRASGTAGVFTGAGLERRFRDLHVAVQHAAGLPMHIQAAGRVLLGLAAGAR